MCIKVVLVDDQELFREGLNLILEKHDDIEVVGEASSGEEAVRVARSIQPDVMVMDINMPGSDINGIEATRQIIAENNAIRIIALSIHSNKAYVHRMLKGGATGYLLKEATSSELVGAIYKVMRGETYLSSQINKIIITAFQNSLKNPLETQSTELTRREKQILKLIAEGSNSKQIGSELNIAAKTVDTHKRNLMEKLGIHNMADLIKYAIREGFTSIDP